jgi:hypothetical protein
MKDILITKNKKNAAVIPQTEQAKNIFKKQEVSDGFQVPIKEVYKMLGWAVSHNLSIDTELPMIVPERPRLSSEQLAVIFNTPKNFPQRPLFAFGTSKFKGDLFEGTTKNWSVNDQFDKGVEYPVYYSEGIFVVGKDGKAYKMTPVAWTKIKEY